MTHHSGSNVAFSYYIVYHFNLIWFILCSNSSLINLLYNVSCQMYTNKLKCTPLLDISLFYWYRQVINIHVEEFMWNTELNVSLTIQVLNCVIPFFF